MPSKQSTCVRCFLVGSMDIIAGKTNDGVVAEKPPVFYAERERRIDGRLTWGAGLG